MPRNQTLIEKRDAAVQLKFRVLKEKNKKWQIDYVIELVAEDFYLSPATVSKILFNQGESVPSVSTISRRLIAVK